ncbi:aldehyde-activating protein [Shewanella sp. Isolate11]|uniref:GFA family protein n=1 Tax=Shewanella sp. Isolate11 TaxID=2908530 RepID=UPI001EFCAC07|nr:aldehyde-activating protein [Shewanella sp. Isolate11]MCG9695509.1 aldehyde-activating protein [Shewanella sp. Isolate11]
MYQGQCHCGNVKLSINRLTETATRCNCSICQRYAGVWGYFSESEVSVTVGELGLDSYEQGDKFLSVKRCKHCGCVTHYTCSERYKKLALEQGLDNGDRFAVNYNMFPRELIAQLTIKYLDGADTWEYLDQECRI